MADFSSMQDGAEEAKNMGTKYGDLADKGVDELRNMAQQRGIDNADGMNKDQLLAKLTGR